MRLSYASCPTKGGVAACLVVNVWSGMSRNLLFMLNCVAIIITQKLNSDVELRVFLSSRWPPSIST